VGEYSYASPDAEVLALSSFYGAGIWLDPWEVEFGIGDSLEEFTRVEGSPLDSGILSKKRDVYPLRTGCPDRGATSLDMLGEITDGLPTKCWRDPPSRHGPYTYRVNCPRLVYDAGGGPVETSMEFILKWDSVDSWVGSVFPDPFNLALQLLGAYPDGMGWKLYAQFPTGGPVALFSWVLTLGTYRNNFTVDLAPSFQVNAAFVGMDPIEVFFEPAPDDSYANPVDIFP